MIKLLPVGSGLPHPARCAVCGNANNAERSFFWFKYKEKWGQVLICNVCMGEGARLSDDFAERSELDAVLSVNVELRAENDRLELATERFTDRFAGLVSDFLHEVKSGAEDTDPTDEHVDRPAIETVEVGSDPFK